jgi:hypothetical protein
LAVLRRHRLAAPPPPGEAEAASALAQEFEFILPGGILDEHGELHRVGVMRLATALDELEPLRDTSLGGPDDPLVAILVLSRVIVSLGTLATVTPTIIEVLSALDLAYLQRFYAVINFGGDEEMAPDGDN